MTILIKPYNKYSKSARALSRALNTKLSLYKLPSRNDLVVNWGNSSLPFRFTNYDLNNPVAVAQASNKLATFKCLQNKDYILDWTQSKDVVKQWLSQGYKVYVRQYLTSNSGRGIIIIQDDDVIPDAKLYTKHVKLKYEYRVHVFNGKVIDYQQKKKRKGSLASHAIRNHSNNWVFCRTDVVLPTGMSDICIDAVKTLGLNFAAIDIGYCHVTNKCYLFEVNTAPGICNTTLTKYTNAIKEYAYAL